MLRPHNVYECPNGHEPFYSYALNSAVCWCCPDCGATGKWLRSHGGYRDYLSPPRPVKEATDKD